MFLFFLAAGAYLAATSFEKVGPSTVKVVREIGYHGSQVVLKSRPLVNQGKSSHWMLKQPKIPWTGIGYNEKTFKIDDAKEFASSFALYTTDEKTGRGEDRDLVQSYTIEGTIEKIEDWEKFISFLDVDQANFEGRRSPYVRKYRDRIEVIAEQLESIARSGSNVDLYGRPLQAEDKGALMNLVNLIDYWQSELMSRRNFVIGLRDKMGLTTERKIRDFIEKEAPWYGALGVEGFEALADQARQLNEYRQSVYSQSLSLKASEERYIRNEDYLQLIGYAGRAYFYEQSMESIRESLDQAERSLAELEKSFTGSREESDKVSRAYKERLKNKREAELADLSAEEVVSEFNVFRGEVIENLSKALHYDQVASNRQSLKKLEAEEIPKLRLDAAAIEKTLSIVRSVEETLKNEYSKRLWEVDMDQIFSLFNQNLSRQMFFNPRLRAQAENMTKYAGFIFTKNYLEGLYHEMSKYRHLVDDDEVVAMMHSDIKAIIGSDGNDRPQEIEQAVRDYMGRKDSLFQYVVQSMGYEWQWTQALRTKGEWERIRKEKLIPFFQHQSAKSDMTESDELWDAAIKMGLMGEDLSRYRPYRIHQVRSLGSYTETLESIAKEYSADAKRIFNENREMLEASDAEAKRRYSILLARGDDEASYDFAKSMALRDGLQITIPLYDEFSTEWWAKQDEYREKRDALMKNYVYPWIEEHAPAAFEKYMKETPYVDYLERTFGVKFGEIKLSIKTRSLYSNPQTKKIDEDYYDLYEIRLRELQRKMKENPTADKSLYN